MILSSEFWIVLLVVLLSISVFISIGIFFYHRIMNRIKNGLVVRVFMADSTIKQYRYNEIPVDNIATVTETNLKGEDSTFPYTIREECICKGMWGRYIDFDYHVSIPVNPKNRSSSPLMTELKEMFKLIGALLDTDLHVKLLRNSKFENFVRMMLIIIAIGVCISVVFSGIGMYYSMSSKSPSGQRDCALTLDNSTWKTIWVASHSPPPSEIVPQIPN